MPDDLSWFGRPSSQMRMLLVTIGRRGGGRALGHIIKEPVGDASAGPLSPQSRPPLCTPQGRQQSAIHVAGVFALHHALYVQSGLGRGDGSVNELPKYGMDRAEIV
jgi:hypothetical protein